MSKPELSIIIPVYNGERYIEECLNSIMSNTYKNYEVLLIIDGSKDHSIDICKKISSIDERFKIFSQKNQGIVAARNKGLSLANGKYICFSDQDDIIPKNAYENLINTIKNNNVDMCIGSFNKKYEKNEVIGLKYENKSYSTKSNEIVDNFLLPLIMHDIDSKYNKEFINPNNYIWNCLYKNSIIKKYNLRFFNFFEYEDDMLFNIEYIKRTKKIATISSNVYCWRQEKASTNKRKRYTKNILEKDESLKKYLVENLKALNIDNKKVVEYSANLLQSSFIRYFDYECYNNVEPYEILKNNYFKFIECTPITKININNIGFDFVYTNNYINRLLLSKGHIKMAYLYNKYVFKKIVNKIYVLYSALRNT